VERTSPRGGRGGKERPNSAFGRWTSRPDRILGAGGLGLRRHFGIGQRRRKTHYTQRGKKVPFSRLKKWLNSSTGWKGLICLPIRLML